MSKPYTQEQIKTEQKELVDMLIRFYNMQTSNAFRVGTVFTRCSVLHALDRANGDVADIKNHIRTWAKGDKANDIAGCFDKYVGKQEEAPQPVEAPQPTTTAPSTAESAMELLGKVVVEMMAKTKSDEIEARIFDNIEKNVKDFVREEYGTIERKIITVVDGKKTELEGVQHEKFEQVCKFVSNDIPVFLTGDAGCGKNVLCQQVAKALGLDFYFSNAVTQEYKITGFTDAMGQFHETQFYKAFKNGGLFMLDEMDASIPEVLVILNAAIANRYFDFPAPIGYVKAHENFRIIAAGNTFGHGADYEYVGRNQLDMASLDRFAMVKMSYSEAIENAVCFQDLELADFCRAFRKSAQQNGIKIIVSYRAMGNIAKLKDVIGLKEALETCLIKGMEKDDVKMIESNIPDGKYKSALKKVIKAMEN